MIIDGTEYVKAKQDGDIKIVVLQRGWALIGRYNRNGERCSLTDASVIRAWGTTKGLGQLAKEGPQSNTKLDPTHGEVEFHELTSVLTISVDQEKWADKLS